MHGVAILMLVWRDGEAQREQAEGGTRDSGSRVVPLVSDLMPMCANAENGHISKSNPSLSKLIRMLNQDDSRVGSL
jgi:hypothetical protein